MRAAIATMIRTLADSDGEGAGEAMLATQLTNGHAAQAGREKS